MTDNLARTLPFAMCRKSSPEQCSSWTLIISFSRTPRFKRKLRIEFLVVKIRLVITSLDASSRVTSVFEIVVLRSKSGERSKVLLNTINQDERFVLWIEVMLFMYSLSMFAMCFKISSFVRVNLCFASSLNLTPVGQVPSLFFREFVALMGKTEFVVKFVLIRELRIYNFNFFLI